MKLQLYSSSPNSYRLTESSVNSPDVEIETKFRNALNGSSLSNYTLQDLNKFLKLLDPMMIQDINSTMESYNVKKRPIIEVRL